MNRLKPLFFQRAIKYSKLKCSALLFLLAFLILPNIGTAQVLDVDCSNVMDADLDCIADLPPVDNSLPIIVTSCPGAIIDIPPVVTALTNISGNTGCAGDPIIVTRTYTITDLNCLDQIVQCEQVFTIEDDEAPMAPAPPADVMVQCAADVPASVDLTATDNCSPDVTVSPTVVVTPGACANQFVEVRTWTFADACGNESSVSQTITVNDDTAPVAP
ncbi:MAG: hypothetical protein AB8F74_15875, partial [Saprospiraceae bacterium]